MGGGGRGCVGDVGVGGGCRGVGGGGRGFVGGVGVGGGS